uniref:PTBP1-like RNA recognition motif 2 domain-containing protein n=1 Tax=Anopheles farauti TaxID=69004 RepID=A0A182Q2B2_9DIPT
MDGPPFRNNNNNINVTDEPRRKRDVATRPNHILLFTILNPIYPITVDVLHTICQTSLPRCWSRTFDTIESATRAKDSLNGCDIYSGCCTLKIDYAKPLVTRTMKQFRFRLPGGTVAVDKALEQTLEQLSTRNLDLGDLQERSSQAATTVKEVGNGRSPLLQDPTLFGGRPQPYSKYLSPSHTPYNEYSPPTQGTRATLAPLRALEKSPIIIGNQA